MASSTTRLSVQGVRSQLANTDPVASASLPRWVAHAPGIDLCVFGAEGPPCGCWLAAVVGYWVDILKAFGFRNRISYSIHAELH
jgi:hypothetical protein